VRRWMSATISFRPWIMPLQVTIAIAAWIGALRMVQAEEEGEYRFTRIGDTASIDKYLGNRTPVVVPSLLGRLLVVAIGPSAFADQTGVTEIRIPEGVSEVDQGAFARCGSLFTIWLPQSLMKIGSGAFVGCRRLSSLAIPAGVTRIRDMVFADCTSLNRIILPKTLTAIGSQAFAPLRSWVVGV
jgi:BspA type Leucine rich repeat region (6 copies)